MCNCFNLGAESLKKCRQIREQVLHDSKHEPLQVFELLLDTAELELNMREAFRKLLQEKRNTWSLTKQECIEMLNELADVFSGNKPLTRIEKNGNFYYFLFKFYQVDSLVVNS